MLPLEVGRKLTAEQFGRKIWLGSAALCYSAKVWPNFGAIQCCFSCMNITTFHSYFSSTTLVRYIFCIYLAFVHHHLI